MDENLKIILEKFSKTIDELNEFKVAASKVLGRITEIGDISVLTTTACDKTVDRLAKSEAAQTEVTTALSTFLKKTEATVAYERDLGDSIALLNRNFQGVINLSKQLSDGLSSIRQTETVTTKAITDLEQKLTARMTQLEKSIGKTQHGIGEIVVESESDIAELTTNDSQEASNVCAKCKGKKEYSDKPLCLKCWREEEALKANKGSPQTDRPWKTNKGGQ